MGKTVIVFWNLPHNELLQKLGTSPGGLSSSEAARRLNEHGPNSLKPGKKTSTLALFAGQFKSPIIIILIAAALLSIGLGDRIDSILILIIVAVSGILGFWQEKGAHDAVEKLLSLVQVHSTVLRDGTEREVPQDQVVPGDIVRLYAGEGIPGDCRLLESHALFIEEAALTGETFPVEKEAGTVPADSPVAKRTNTVFMGTHVRSGKGTAVVVHTGKETEFGRISGRLQRKEPPAEFERGIRHFGYFLMIMTTLFAVGISVVNILLHRPPLQSLLFALSLAVGFTPQLLPAVISINLARGAKRMSEKKVIVKKLSAIENFGAMNVLCADKTGTLTEGVIQIKKAVGLDGTEKEKILQYAYVNAAFETGFRNPIDTAIKDHLQFDLGGYRRLDEIPYDFQRKRLSISVKNDGRALLITKGAVPQVLEVCTRVEQADGTVVPMDHLRARVEQEYEALGMQGYRVIGVAYKEMTDGTDIRVEDESEMIFLGYLVIFDPLKPGINATIDKIRALGINLKIITGDNKQIAASVTRQVRLTDADILTGQEIERMSDADLQEKIKTVDVFAEVAPVHKERIIAAFKTAENVVGYIGDGINDTPGFHAADVSISVNTAVDAAKAEAKIILLEKDLGVLADGVYEGRKTFANTMKYIFIATGANFGNMFSMSGGSLILPFLPALPSQILLTNLLTDLPALTMATDRVDPEVIERPRRWNLRFIRRFMLTFGILSSVFDYLTFGILWYILRTGETGFRSGWFMESVALSALIVLAVRTRRVFFRSPPSKWLLGATTFDVIVVILLPYTFIGHLFSLYPLPTRFLGYLAVLTVIFFAATEAVKKTFYRRAQKMGIAA